MREDRSPGLRRGQGSTALFQENSFDTEEKNLTSKIATLKKSGVVRGGVDSPPTLHWAPDVHSVLGRSLEQNKEKMDFAWNLPRQARV